MGRVDAAVGHHGGAGSDRASDAGVSAELVLAERRSGRRRQPWQRGAVCVVAAMMGTVTMKAERAGTTRDWVCAGYAAGSERYVLCSSCPPRAHAACAQPLLISAVLPFWLLSPRLSPPLPRFRYLPPPLPAAVTRTSLNFPRRTAVAASLTAARPVRALSWSAGYGYGSARAFPARRRRIAAPRVVASAVRF